MSLRSSSKASLNSIVPAAPCHPAQKQPTSHPAAGDAVVLGRDVQPGASLERRWQKVASLPGGEHGAVLVAAAGSHSAEHFSCCPLVVHITMQGRIKSLWRARK